MVNATKQPVTKKHQGAFSKHLARFFRRFHLLMFFIFVVGCLAAAVVLINNALTESSSQDYTSSISAGTIDQATLERIQALHTSDQPTASADLPSGRVNPFAE